MTELPRRSRSYGRKARCTAQGVISRQRLRHPRISALTSRCGAGPTCMMSTWRCGLTDVLLSDILDELRNISSTLVSIDAKLDLVTEGYSLKNVVDEISSLKGDRGTDLADLLSTLSDIEFNTNTT
jgi:hypothetical protein